jgi:hypothetical protein
MRVAGGPEKSLCRRVLDALGSGDAGAATNALRALSRAGPDPDGKSPELADVWTAFTRLLHRRGYWVTPPADLDASLREIREMGSGFDLYELLGALAAFDFGPASRAFRASDPRPAP